MEKEFDFTSLMDQLSKAVMVYPEKRIDIGYSWGSEETISAPFFMRLKNTYTLIEYDNDTFTIEVNSDIETDKTLEFEDSDGSMKKYDLKGNQSGYIIGDRKTGILTSSTVTQDISGNVYSISPQKMTIPMFGTTKVYFKTLD